MDQDERSAAPGPTTRAPGGARPRASAAGHRRTSPDPDRIAIDVLGPRRVRIGDAVLGPEALAGQKPKQLLGILALARGAPVSKGRLADLLWGEQPPTNVSGTLATYVSVLRHRIGLGSALQSRGVAYRLDTARVQLDLDEFDRAVAAASGRPPRQARLHLERALGLIRNELLADEPYAEWVEPDRSRYRRRHVEVLVAAAEAALACRDFDSGTGLVERALRVDPFDEPAARLLLVGLYALGRRAAALHLYDEFTARLDAELGVTPAADLQEAAEAVRRGEPAAALLPPIAPDVRARLCDINPPGTPFLGRAAEMAALTTQAASLREGRCGLVLVEGETGMGKTRLVRELAAKVDVPVGMARCFQAERRLPYAALLRALRDALARSVADPVSDVVGDVLGGSDGDHERRVLPALGRLVDEHGPVVVVLDDAHWADRGSLNALHYLSCVHPALAVATARPRIMALQHPLHLFDAVLRVALRPLSPDEVAVVGVPELHETTGGLPLLVAAWLQARSEDRLPELAERLAPLADEEVRRAGAPARDLLAAAAGLERGFVLDDVVPVVGPITLPIIDAVEHLCDAGLLRERCGRYEVGCTLVRDLCLSVLLPVRVRLVAELLRRHQGTGSGPGGSRGAPGVASDDENRA